MAKWLKYLSPILFLIGIQSVFAEGQEGTGINSVSITVTTDQRLVLQAQDESTTVIGSAGTQQNYGELILDQLNENGQLTPDWGKAEVLLGCYQADVLLYQQQPQGWVEIAAVQTATDYCPQ